MPPLAAQTEPPFPPLRCFLLLFALALAAGCNYSVVRYREAGSDAPRLYLQTLDNGTAEAGLGRLFTESLRREVLRRGGLRLVGEPAKADFQVEGSVLQLDTVSRSLSSTVLALEYTVRMRLALDLRRRDGTRIPLDPRAQNGSEVYLTSPDVEAGRKNRQESLRRVSELLAVRVVDALDQVAFP